MELDRPPRRAALGRGTGVRRPPHLSPAARRSLLDRIEHPRAGWIGALAALFAPGPCRECGLDLAAFARGCLCAPCWASLPANGGPRCGVCDLPLAASGAACPDCAREDSCGASPNRPEIERLVAAFVYEGAVRRLHRRLKFDGETGLARPLARRMAIAWRLRGGFRPEICAPVPPDPLRRPPRRRSARVLARAVARELGCAFSPRALRKTRSTAPQTGRGRDERGLAIAGSYRARATLVRDRLVLVVDDVATSCATLGEAVRALDAAGAARIGSLVLARTPARGYL